MQGKGQGTVQGSSSSCRGRCRHRCRGRGGCRQHCHAGAGAGAGDVVIIVVQVQVQVPGDDGGTTEVVGEDGRIGGGTTSSEDEAGGLGPRGAGKLCTLEQKVMLLSNQSINGSCQWSQLCPRTSKQEESSKVT